MIETLSEDKISALSVLDQYLIGHKGFVCGGCFKDIFNKKELRDVDIYFYSKEDYEQAIEYFTAKCVDGVYNHHHDLINGKAYKNNTTGIIIELCSCYFGSPTEILGKFDFSICKFSYFKTIMGEWDVVYHPDFFYHLQHNVIDIDGIIYNPVNTFIRSYKYVKYGYNPSIQTLKKIITELEKIDINAVDFNMEILY